MHYWNKIKYKNLTFFLFSIVLASIVFRNETLHAYLFRLGDFGYIGAFMAGMLFVSTFTVATGVIILLVLAEKLSPLEIGIIAGMGAVCGDFIIFRFMKDTLMGELVSLYNQIDSNHHFIKILHTNYFAWTLPVIGSIIIASPFPDEIGVSLLGISHMKTYQFLLISFVLNALGVFLVISASVIIKP